MPYGLYDGSLKSIPGLGGFLQQTEINQQADAHNLQSGVALMSMLKEHKAMQDDQAVRQALSQGGDPAQLIQSLVKIGSPAAIQTAGHVMTINKAQQEMDALKGLDLKNPDALRRAALASPQHAGAFNAMADHMEKQQAATAEHQAQMGIETPITSAPTMGFQPKGGFAERSNIAPGGQMVPSGAMVGNQATTEALPPEVVQAMASGKPFNIGVGPSANPAENTQRAGGLFESFANDPIRIGQANAQQRQVNTSDPLALAPQKFNDIATQMQNKAIADQQAMAMLGVRDTTANRRIDAGVASGAANRDARRENILLNNGLGPDGALNESGKQMAAAIADGQLKPIEGTALIRPGARAIMSEVMRINPKFESQQYGVSFATEKGFTSGKQGNTIKSFNTAIDHLGTLGELADALHNGSTPIINRIANFIATQTGQPAPNTFEAAKQIVGDEIVKAIVGAGGGVTDREHAQATIAAAASPQQLREVIDNFKKLMGGQLHGLHQQYISGGGKKDFNSFLTEEAKAVANIPTGGALLPTEVKLPDGRTKTFVSPAAAQAFKAAAGL